jgi:hypothetical protein
VLLTFAGMLGAATAQVSERPKLETNQAYIEELMRESTLAIKDPFAAFAFVFESLPERVKVYPTENYYYFKFLHNGVPYAGNIRIEPGDDDKVTVHFAYFEELTEWRDDAATQHVFLDAAHGVTVEKVERLVYRLTYGGKSVVFALNDLSQVKPPASALGPDEKFIGPIFDESAIRFFLVYNQRLKIFHYILDETEKVPDEFFPAKRTDRIIIGKRTGFAFYRDHKRERKILIGVFDANYRLNTYFDGPFDQLPDNFIEGETLREIILELSPGLKGKIDRFGSSWDGTIRFQISPYVPYRTQDDLYGAHACATSRLKAASYYQCFNAVNSEVLNSSLSKMMGPAKAKK